ncbi:hypothetical protein GOBAR_DD00728 [Gossypium barbadense]|nr:hypothetical protein GOBAR_DD00728 [Gossypium barbadense]
MVTKVFYSMFGWVYSSLATAEAVAENSFNLSLCFVSVFSQGVLDGYNGTIMAYGQIGTGKTYTLGRLGEEDIANCGIMVRAMEDILAEVSPEIDSVLVSYLQLYMESLQDLLDPTNDNISIVEEPKSGDVSLPGATLVEIRDQQSFMSLFIGLYLVDFHFTVFS